MDLLISYGSLLSRESREKYSNIHQPVDLVKLQGWKRQWGTPYVDEGATYAGAAPDSNSSLHGVLVPVEMSDELRQRERGYDFIEIVNPAKTLNFLTNNSNLCLIHSKVWIAGSKVISPPHSDCPLPQTYVDTCLVGCLEIGGEELVYQFVRETIGWNEMWVNDREQEIMLFPRAASVNAEQILLFDSILKKADILKYRTTQIK